MAATTPGQGKVYHKELEEMSKMHGMVLAAMMAVVVAGCGKPDGASPTSASSGGDSTAAAPAVGQSSANPNDPAAVVNEFLESVRTGNDEKACHLLSSVAREKTASLNRNVTPPASDTARFTVGKVDYVGDDGARVLCTWTDVDDQQQSRTDTAIWVLRREQAGWRVAGVAAMVFPDRDPVVLNFEDPEDMVRQQQWVREEMRRRTEQESLQAQDPATQEKPVVR
jgi:hypothetical protein